jgi:hypothetical protein
LSAGKMDAISCNLCVKLFIQRLSFFLTKKPFS